MIVVEDFEYDRLLILLTNVSQQGPEERYNF